MVGLRVPAPTPRLGRLDSLPGLAFLCHLFIGMWRTPRRFRPQTGYHECMTGSFADLPVLYLTTIGRTSGLPRQIEIWFVAAGDKFYILAEHFRRAHWVRNIERNPRVQVRIGSHERTATARILDETADREAWNWSQDMAREKYGWGDGLPVEITPDQPL
jgi:deazaflavin-dependent oxidoreductase (nitroreductase family)